MSGGIIEEKAVHDALDALLRAREMAVERAKQMITDVITRAASRPSAQSFAAPDGRAITVEMSIPATKCGLVIGKMGETIKQLQEQAGCKMVMIQDSQEVTGQAKPLRITGDPEKVEIAKRLVTDLINSREDNGSIPRLYSEQATAKGEVVVPRASVGMIIGKGGETIKRLAMETGTKIQFKADDDPTSPDRCAVIMGSREQIYKATELITELVHKSCSGSMMTGQTEAFYMHVPSNKTGLVIGKGGETIKQINAESGAHCELSRDPPPNPQEKVFIIRGTPYQVHHAQHIIRIKVCAVSSWFYLDHYSLTKFQTTLYIVAACLKICVDIAPRLTPSRLHSQARQCLHSQVLAHQMVITSVFPNIMDSTVLAYGIIHMVRKVLVNGISIQKITMSKLGQQADAGNGWASQAGQYYTGAAANAQNSYGNMQGYTYVPQSGAQPAATSQSSNTTSSGPTINPQTGQPDYSAQWAEYYRSMGLHDQAALIEAQMKQNAARTAAASANPPPPGTTPTQSTFSNAAYPATSAATATSQYSGYSGAQTQNFPATGQFQSQQQQF
ncbi:KH domain protein [Necator americanus]|uniref:KH domain protein n=1 Tax=Necator americanus TaxID=51031 RepID=W2SHI6_NECAM|nr:KH domain protein [Necator americanus]ETN68316.1 KH domain protein [Necator americanus]